MCHARDIFLQNAPVTSWPSQRQVLVPSWQQLPGLASQGIPESWRRPLVIDNLDSASTVIPMVQWCSYKGMHYYINLIHMYLVVVNNLKIKLNRKLIKFTIVQLK